MENEGRGNPPDYKGNGDGIMYTVSDILEDIQRKITANNMIETCFSYRLVYFLNENGKGRKCYIDTSYGNLRRSFENIIRENLSTTNCIVLAAVTTRKSGETVSLLSRSYSFSLDGYFEQIIGKKEKEYKTVNCGRRRAQWC